MRKSRNLYFGSSWVPVVPRFPYTPIKLVEKCLFAFSPVCILLLSYFSFLLYCSACVVQFLQDPVSFDNTELLLSCVVWSLNNHNYQDSDRKSVCDTPKKSRNSQCAAAGGLQSSDRVERPADFCTAHPFVGGFFYTLHFHQKLSISSLKSELQFSTMSDKEFEERFNEAWNEVNNKL